MMKQLWICLCTAATFAAAAEESATINRNHVNVRGAPTVNSEVVARLQKGDPVTFLEEVAADRPKKDEPARWAAIKLPAGAKVWVFTGFLDGNTVKVKRLNLRAGPGENFSVLGRLEKGDQVKEIRTVDQWMEIEPPDNVRAYVDASYIDRPAPEAGKEIAQAEAPKPPLEQKPVVYEPPSRPVPTVVKQEPVTVTQAPKEEKKIEPEVKPVKSETDPKPAEVAVVPPPAVVPPKPEENTPKPVVPEPAAEPAPARVLPPVAPAIVTDGAIPVAEKRIVRREGEVRTTKFNIQAPTYFQLMGEKGKVLNYLNAEKTGLKLKDYKGLRVVVTGEESIDPRFPDRPLLEVETIEVAP